MRFVWLYSIIISHADVWVPIASVHRTVHHASTWRLSEAPLTLTPPDYQLPFLAKGV